MMDPLLIQGVISNLVDNSLKYGTENPEITVTLREEGNRVCLDVADNGPGIPEPYLGRVFDKFFRVPNGDRHNIKGYGLGLSFASVVMDQHHGDITVRNLKSGGCAFTLRFPKTSA
jgi:K+-sensing histidine kinase KdpD